MSGSGGSGGGVVSRRVGWARGGEWKEYAKLGKKTLEDKRREGREGGREGGRERRKSEGGEGEGEKERVKEGREGRSERRSVAR